MTHRCDQIGGPPFLENIMKAPLAVPTLCWRSYWRRAPLALQARLGDREEDGLAEALAFLADRPAVAIAVPDAARVAQVQAAVRESGIGVIRLRAEPVAGGGAALTLVLMIASPATDLRQVEAAAVHLSCGQGLPWRLLPPGADGVVALQALVASVLPSARTP
jgi:hypothetical protein